jgi:putative transposase
LLWIVIKPENRKVLALKISKERDVLIAERFIADLVRSMGNILYEWMVELYSQSFRFLKLDHHAHFSLENSLIERKDNAVHLG